MHLGIVMSAGGGAFEAAARIAGPGWRFTIITDRPCGAEEAAARLGARAIRIEEKGRKAFSAKAATEFRSEGVSQCLLYFDRLVSAELYDAVETANIHPAALPAFPGLTGVEDAYAHRARLLGCSLHRVDATVDGGPLIAQLACGADPAWPFEAWSKRAYLMKVYCGLIWMGMAADILDEVHRPVNASYGLPAQWRSAFQAVQDEAGVWVI